MKKREALDANDRLQALIVWPGLVFCGGFVVPAIVLALNWSKPQSLARHHAALALIVCAGVMVVYVPAVVRMAIQGGPDAVFFTVWGVVASVLVVATIVNFVHAWRAPVMTPTPR